MRSLYSVSGAENRKDRPTHVEKLMLIQSRTVVDRIAIYCYNVSKVPNEKMVNGV